MQTQMELSISTLPLLKGVTMKWIDITELNSKIATTKILRFETRNIFNTAFNCNWEMQGMLFDDNSFVGICPEGDELSYLEFEEGK